MTNIVFTKRMAGVIYRAIKEEKIIANEKEVKYMYDIADNCQGAFSKTSYYQNHSDIIDSFNNTITAIFENNYEEAQKSFREATKMTRYYYDEDKECWTFAN